MKAIISTVFLLSFLFYSHAQKNIDIRYVIDSDTLSSTAKVYTNMFDKNRITELSITNRLILKDEDGRKKVNVADIKFLEFTDFKKQKRTFVSSNLFPEFGLKDILLEEKLVGNISWYKYYYGSLTGGNQTTINYFINKERQFVKGEGPANIRKRLPNIIENKERFIEKINTIRGYLIDEVDIKISDFLSYYNK